MPIKRTHIFGTLAAGAVAVGLTAYFSGEEEPSTFERQLESFLPPPPVSGFAMSVPLPTEENIAAIRTLFEQTRDELIASSPIILSEIKAASPDGEGRIEIRGNTANIFDQPLAIVQSNFDVERQVERAAERIASYKPEIFELSGEKFGDAVYMALSDGLSLWYAPYITSYQSGKPVATYNIDSDRVCQPIAAAWQEAGNENIDCFPAASMAPYTALAVDVAAIRRHVGAPAPAR